VSNLQPEGRVNVCTPIVILPAEDSANAGPSKATGEVVSTDIFVAPVAGDVTLTPDVIAIAKLEIKKPLTTKAAVVNKTTVFLELLTSSDIELFIILTETLKATD